MSQECPLSNRRPTRVIPIGDLPLGGKYPIRIQSMTTPSTRDIEASVKAVLNLHEAGSEYVRLTVPTMEDAHCLKEIRKQVRAARCNAPLIADVHFNPKVALASADFVEKVRINPGNYADRKLGKIKEYSDAAYSEELEKVFTKFQPLLTKCKQNGIAMRIGVNHGSLSDRIMNRYGDTPRGMVFSALEFIEMAEQENYHHLVLSMKSSIPQVMIEAYRLLVSEMNARQMNYPLHLGVTEAGEGLSGRVKSALGIGTLLLEGLGDTVRVSLTEPPENEIPVARKLVSSVRKLSQHSSEIIPSPEYSLKTTVPKLPHLPAVGALVPSSHPTQQGMNLTEVPDFWVKTDPSATLPASLSAQLVFQDTSDPNASSIPLFRAEKLEALPLSLHAVWLNLQGPSLSRAISKFNDQTLIFAEPPHKHFTEWLGQLISLLKSQSLSLPLFLVYREQCDFADFLLNSALHLSVPLHAGWPAGLLLINPSATLPELLELSYQLLQAARLRITRPEFISCPSCGRTLFDLETTTAKVKKATEHLTGLKIAIMGCIVNGPGEMADADYGYVGAAPGKISLYRSKEAVLRNIPAEEAVARLVELIQADGKWIDP